MINKVFVFILCALLFTSCNKVVNKRPDFFINQKTVLGKGGDFSIFYINIDSIVSLHDNKIGYFFKSLIYYNEVRGTEGVIYLNNNCVYLRLKDASTDFKLFDFNLIVNACDTVNYSLILHREVSTDTINKKFQLCLEDKFFDSEIADSIYQFKLENFGINLANDDIVLFIGKNVGLRGYYLGDRIQNNESENAIDIYYYVRGNIYKDRNYFKQLFLKEFQ